MLWFFYFFSFLRQGSQKMRCHSWSKRLYFEISQQAAERKKTKDGDLIVPERLKTPSRGLIQFVFYRLQFLVKHFAHRIDTAVFALHDVIFPGQHRAGSYIVYKFRDL